MLGAEKKVLELSDFNANRGNALAEGERFSHRILSRSIKTSCFRHVKKRRKNICFRGHMGTEKSKGFQ